MTDQWSGGKGDKLRKNSDLRKYKENWEKIFGKNKNEYKYVKKTNKNVT